jgi:hypothetical protein
MIRFSLGGPELRAIAAVVLNRVNARIINIVFIVFSFSSD